MKFSFIAAIAAAALAITADARSEIVLYNKENLQGTCASFPVHDYDVCYIISEFYQPKSASYYNDDSSTDQVTVTFYETGNCGGKWRRISSKMPYRAKTSWNKIEYVYGVAGSVMVQKSKDITGNGKSSQYRKAYPAKYSEGTKC
ncbi:MAG: hypothetical protein J3Q66DRAFT_402957 [Benniella sp.]|nr:MAG: hypothetical protein J3Q66DRAFT_402957 [Benniella sp.]